MASKFGASGFCAKLAIAPEAGCAGCGKSTWSYIIDRDQPLSEQIEVLVEALRDCDLEQLYLSPEARRILQSVPSTELYACLCILGIAEERKRFELLSRQLKNMAPAEYGTYEENVNMADGTNDNLTPEQMAARIKELEGRLAKGGTLRFKVSEKGAVSVYGLGRFPVTLYLEQWDKLLSHADELRAFIEANKSMLKTKDQVSSQR